MSKNDAQSAQCSAKSVRDIWELFVGGFDDFPK
jgi:hypothetical protein